MLCRKCKKEIPEASAYCNHCGAKQVVERSLRVRGNGEGTVFMMPSGKWRAEVTLGYNEDGKADRRTKTGFVKKKDAIAYLPILRGEKADESITLRSLYESWKNSDHFAGLSSSKQTAYKIAYDKLKPVRGKPLGNLRIEELQAVLDSVPGYYPRRDMRQVLSHLYRIAEINGDAEKNYAKYLRLPTLEAEEQEAFNEKEIFLFWKDYNSGNLFTGYILLMIYAGMGPGELMKTKKSMINWDEQTIVGAGVKTRKGKEFPIIIADDLVPILRDLCKSAMDSSALLPMCENKFRELFDETLSRIGVRPLKPYNCRHTCATALTLAGIEPAVIRAVMRHTKYQTTLGYTHVAVKPLLEAVNKITKGE